MNTFKCVGFKKVTIDGGLSEAAEVFAARSARKKYGKSADVRTCTQTAYSLDGNMAEYSAFIGYKSGQNETTGHNINFTVSRCK